MFILMQSEKLNLYTTGLASIPLERNTFVAHILANNFKFPLVIEYTNQPIIITNLHGRKWSSQLYATSVVISVT